MPEKTQLPTPQYNRESGKKTLILVSILISIIVTLTILSFILLARQTKL